jgi:HEAT repeat protein
LIALGVPTRPEIERSLSLLFDAERTCRGLHDELSGLPSDALLDVLEGALAAAVKESREDEASLRLVRIAGLLGELEGPRAVDLLIDVLASEHPEARSAAGRELEELAFDRFKEVAKGVERALKRLPAGSPALPEIPYILAEIPEPGVMKLLGQFLAHADPDAVAASIEAMVELGDPAAIKLIAPLAGDKRTVELADDEAEDESAEVTLGELAAEAVDILGENERHLERGADAGDKA